MRHFRALLLARRARLQSTVEAMQEGALRAGDQDTSVDHLADHASDVAEQDLTLTFVENERHEIYEIGRALMRIEEGTYGVCQGTGEPIGRPRLEAIPYARYTIAYQSKIESGEIDAEEDLA